MVQGFLTCSPFPKSGKLLPSINDFVTVSRKSEINVGPGRAAGARKADPNKDRDSMLFARASKGNNIPASFGFVQVTFFRDACNMAVLKNSLPAICPNKESALQHASMISLFSQSV